MAIPSLHLSPGRQFVLTWSIPDDFGGMTNAFLHRSRAFVRLANRPVEILTFDARPDYPDLEARLRRSGDLIDGLSLFNVWDWLRDHDAAARDDAAAPSPQAFSPLPVEAGTVSTSRGTAALSRSRMSPDGAVLQVDYYRLDGSLLASDRRDVLVPGEPGGRSVTLCDRRGIPIRHWTSIWGLYRHWIDELRQREPSFLIVDSKTVARFAATYRRKQAVIVHVVHSSHLQGEQRPIGPLRESRREVFENLGDYDAVVVLTPRQREDVEQLLGPVPNVRVIPNSRDLAAVDRPHERPVGQGAVVASLTTRKRVDHAALAAFGAALRTGGLVTLDVFGDGPERGDILAALRDAGAGDAVRFHGHVSDAAVRLSTESFILLTGRTEGFPLVLVEAMAAGCIPIAYDVPYGPADMIADGRNGFLVPSGDLEALTEAIITLVELPARRIAKLRRSAQKSAAQYSDLAVTRTWARELQLARTRHAERWAADHPAK